MIAATIDWTLVLVAAISSVPATLAALVGLANRRALRTPSGDPIGHVVERTHDLTAVQTLAVGVEAKKPMEDSARRLNADDASPVKVNGGVFAAEIEGQA